MLCDARYHRAPGSNRRRAPARLVGTDPERVVCAVDDLLSNTRAYQAMAKTVNPYGDGCAAHRTVAAIEHLFNLGPRPAPFEPTATAC